jgi:hypothetical protein
MLIPRRGVVTEMSLNLRKLEKRVSNGRGVSSLGQNNNSPSSLLFQVFVSLESINVLGVGTSLLPKSLDTIACICTLSLDIDLADCRYTIDGEVSIGLPWGLCAVHNVLVVRTKDIEYGSKFPCIFEITKIPDLDLATPTTPTTLRKGVWLRIPDRDSVRVNYI